MPPLVRRLILCLCAVVGFAGAAALLHRTLPLHMPEVTPKLEYIKAHLGEFDTVFIGSSRIYHGVSPKVFDAAMAAGGAPARSFNLAVNGMMPPESLRMTRALIAMGPPRLRRVFLEVCAAQEIPDPATATVRDVYRQDLDALEYSLRRARLDYRMQPQRYRWQTAWDDATRGATLFARNEFNMGRLIPTPDFAPPQPDWPAQVLMGPDGDGYVPELHPMTAVERARLEQRVEAVRNRTAKAPLRDPLSEEGYARIGELLARNGIELILIAAPVTTRDYLARQDAPPGTKVLAFDDPDRHPELYAPEHRFDSDHLNPAGAQIFSRELAEAYLAEK